MNFAKKPRKKLALDPSVLMASLRSSVLNVPRVASPGLSRRSRAYVKPDSGNERRLARQRDLIRV